MILAQMGWGASDLVERGIKDQSIRGAVLSPRSTKYSEIPFRATDLHKKLGPSGLVLFDPQFYALTIPGADLHRLQNYPYFAGGLTTLSFPPDQVTFHAERVTKFQASLDVDRWLSPTVLFSAFNDNWSQIAFSLGQASCKYHTEFPGKKKPLLVSLVFDEQALRDQSAMQEFLDNVSTLDADGFYVIVRRGDAEYPALFDERALANLMYLTYTLAEVNDFEVIHAYTDFVGPLLTACGAKAICTGWFQSLRQFGPKQFLPSVGGRQPRPRYTSRQLANSVLVNPEMISIYSKGLVNSVISGTPYDASMRTGPGKAPWPAQDSFLHHWCSLAAILSKIPAKGTIKQRLDVLEQWIDTVQTTYDSLTKAKLIFGLTSGPRNVPSWKNAVKMFRSDAKV